LSEISPVETWSPSREKFRIETFRKIPKDKRKHDGGRVFYRQMVPPRGAMGADFSLPMVLMGWQGITY
jgi:hypothetical protein